MSAVCACGCGRPLSRSGRGRPAVYATAECRRSAEYAVRRLRREEDSRSPDVMLPRAARRGWLVHKQPPTTQAANGERLADEVIYFHGPAVESPDDPRLARFAAAVRRIIREGSGPLRAVHAIGEYLTPDGRRAVAYVVRERPEREADLAAQLAEMRDPLRQRGHDEPAAEAGPETRPTGEGGVSAARWWWLHHDWRMPTRDALSQNGLAPRFPEGTTCQEFYDRDPRRWRHLRGYILEAT